MGVEFIAGRPGGYAASYVDRRISDLEHEDLTAPICVITPSQSTFGIEEEILQEDGLSGHLGLYVTTPQKLAVQILNEVHGGGDDSIDMAGKSMLVRRILDEQKTRLESFRNAAAATQLPFLIAEQLSRFRAMDITVPELTEYANATGNQRLLDLAVVYDALDNILKNEMADLMDAEARMDLAIEYMSKARFLKETKLVVVRGFSTFTNQQIKFFEELMNVAPNLVFLFPLVQEDEPDARIYEGARSGMTRLSFRAGQKGLTQITWASDLQASEQQISDKKDAPDSEQQRGAVPVRDIASPADIVFASEHLFAHGKARNGTASSSMFVGEATDIEQEVRAVAAQIARLHLEEHTPFSRMAVVWGETTEYEPVVHRVFGEANIPHFTGEQKTLAQSNLSEFILTAVELAAGNLSKEAFLAHVATGFTELTIKEQSVLLNYAFSRVSKGDQFQRSFNHQDRRDYRDLFVMAEDARSRVMRPIMKHLRGPLSKEQTKERTLPAGKIFEAVENYVNAVLTEQSVLERASLLGESFEQASFLEQTYKNALSILQQAKDILKDTQVTPLEARGILQSGFEAIKLSLVPAGTDEVQAGSLGRIHVPYVEHLFVVGVNDEVLPRFSTVSKDILTPTEWTSLVREIKKLDIPSNVDEQKYSIVQAMRQAKKTIHWSYRVDSENRPSVLIPYLDNLFPGKLERVDLDAVAQMLAPNAYDTAVKRVRDLADGKKNTATRDLARGIFAMKEFQSRTQYLETSLTQTNQAVSAPPSVNVGKMSSTRLSTFYKCPFEHFLQYQLGLWVPQGPEMNVQASGTYVHEALKEVSERVVQLQQENHYRSWKDIRKDLYDAEVENAIAEVVETINGVDVDPRSHAVMNVLDPQIRRVTQELREQYAPNRPELWRTELPFDIPGLGVTGIIDRVDRLRRPDGTDFYSIIDYKSGATYDFSLEKLLAGTDMQLLLYILGLQQIIPPADRLNSYLAQAGYIHLLPQNSDLKPTSAKEKREKEEHLAEWWKTYSSQGILAIPPSIAIDLYGVNDSSYLNSVYMKVTGKGAYYGQMANRVYLPGALPGLAPGESDGAFDALLACTTDLTKRAITQINQGVNAIEPYKGSDNSLPCQYCEFNSICGFEDGRGALKPRRLVNPDTGKSYQGKDKDKEMRKLLLDQYGRPMKEVNA